MRSADEASGYRVGFLDSPFWTLTRPVARYRCPACKNECRPLLELLGVEPGRLSGSLARLLGLLAVVVPYPLAAQLAWLLLSFRISPMGVWKVAQRLGESAARYSDALSQYHADSRSEGAPTGDAPPAVVLSVDGSMLGMQVRQQRRRRTGAEPLPPLPPVQEGQFQEVKTGVLLLPSERVETSPGHEAIVEDDVLLDVFLFGKDFEATPVGFAVLAQFVGMGGAQNNINDIRELGQNVRQGVERIFDPLVR